MILIIYFIMAKAKLPHHDHDLLWSFKIKIHDHAAGEIIVAAFTDKNLYGGIFGDLY